eukprot:10879944-Alexandrium_andersonii.AAC.1
MEGESGSPADGAVAGATAWVGSTEVPGGAGVAVAEGRGERRSAPLPLSAGERDREGRLGPG